MWGCCAVPMFADWLEGLAGISQVERFNPMKRRYYLGTVVDTKCCSRLERRGK
jgi:hypothetical protein